ncbi:MAG: YfhO family protein [Candidatus Limivivens sp.]|nr:YfhO family protein [Candidatus Limivivens sp.]
MKKLWSSQKTRSIVLLLGLLGISSLVIYREFLFGDSYFTFCSLQDSGSDTGQQYLFQYQEVVNHLLQGDFSMWDFRNGLGINMFQLNLFDPSLILLYLLGVLKGADHMVIYLIYTQILKILAAGVVGYLFLSCFPLSERAKVFAAYIYGLNGFLMVWGQHYQFGMVMVYLPLILLMLERSLKAGKVKAGLPLYVFLTVISSLYFSYMCCLTAGFYLIFRMLFLEEEPVRKRWSLFLRICVGMLFGVGMGLCTLLPSAYVIFGVTSRMEKDSSLLETLLSGFQLQDPEYYHALLYRFFSANVLDIQKDYSGQYNYYEDPAVFASVFNVILGSQFLLVLHRTKLSARKKKVLYGASLFMAFAVLLPFMGIVYNGFSGTFSRFTFVLMPFFALMMAWMADYFLEGGKGCFPGLAVILVLIVWVYGSGYQSIADETLKKLILLMGLVGILGAAAVAAMALRKDSRARKGLFLAVMALTVADMSLEGIGTVTGRYALSKKDTTYLPELYSQDVEDALAYLEETDPEFYRVEKTYQEQIRSMSAVVQGYYGVSTYNSMQNGNVVRFVELCRPELFHLDRNHYLYCQVGSYGKIGSFLGVRYLLTKGEEPDGYEYLCSFGTVDLYRCEREASLGAFYGEDQVISEEQFIEEVQKARAEQGRDAVDELLLGTLGLEGADASGNVSEAEEERGGSVTLAEGEKGGTLVGTARASEDGYLLFTIPYEKGWTVFVDGEEQETLRGNIGFTAVKIEKGNHELRLTYQVPYLKEGICFSAVFWLLYLVYFGFNGLRVRKKR